VGKNRGKLRDQEYLPASSLAFYSSALNFSSSAEVVL
jgi:hypothetical protein